MKSGKYKAPRGFTIVELLVVIVVIGILAAITIVVYSGITRRAYEASLGSDLTSASTQLKNYYTDNGQYPASLVRDGDNYCPLPADTRYCFKASTGNEFSYNRPTPSSFYLNNVHNPGSIKYRVTDHSGVVSVLTCPTGFIDVPGSSTYGTSDFCVMKYEAKNAGGNIPVSQATGTPWVSISQTNSISYSANVVGCTGCHLISEAEWMTIAQNVLSVDTNWDDGSGNHTVGTGYIYSGYNYNTPATTIAASDDDALGYTGTGQSAPSNQRRTLTLTNGEVIWDLAGNAWEWTSGTVQSPLVQPGITGQGLAWREWTAITNPGTMPVNPSPAGTGISGASGWNSTNGVGRLYTNTEETGTRGFLRSGYWSTGADAGVLTLSLGGTTGFTHVWVGFRVAK